MKRLFFSLSVLIFFLCLLSCRPKYMVVVSAESSRPIEELKELVLTKGDTAAYDELMIAHLSEVRFEEYLGYSLYMAHRYNYPPAYWGVYTSLVVASESYGHAMDERTKELALTYLKRGADLKDYNSLKILSTLYKVGKYVPRDTIRSQQLSKEMKKADIIRNQTNNKR